MALRGYIWTNQTSVGSWLSISWTARHFHRMLVEHLEFCFRFMFLFKKYILFFSCAVVLYYGVDSDSTWGAKCCYLATHLRLHRVDWKVPQRLQQCSVVIFSFSCMFGVVIIVAFSHFVHVFVSFPRIDFLFSIYLFVS